MSLFLSERPRGAAPSDLFRANLGFLEMVMALSYWLCLLPSFFSLLCYMVSLLFSFRLVTFFSWSSPLSFLSSLYSLFSRFIFVSVFLFLLFLSFTLSLLSPTEKNSVFPGAKITSGNSEKGPNRFMAAGTLDLSIGMCFAGQLRCQGFCGRDAPFTDAAWH